MSTIELTIENFEQTLKENEIVIIDFWAEWCAPCKSFGPIFEKASESNPDVVFAKVDTEAQQELAGGLGIRSIPTTMIFRDNILLMSQPGVLPESDLNKVLDTTRELDMDEVRAKVEEQQQKEKATA